MATKPAKSDTKAPANTNLVQPGAPILDITKLTPAQLAQLQAQLKAKSKVVGSKKELRFGTIDKMLKEKDEAGGFRHTTREIFNALVAADCVDTTLPDHGKVEIKKIQARKQFLEKRTNEKGELIDPKGTYGYKASEAAGFTVTPAKVVLFFQDADQVALLTGEQRAAVLEALGE